MVNNGAGSIANVRKKFHQTHELISTAHHEAGHAIYGLLHYIEVEYVDVFEDKKTKRIMGLTHYSVSEIDAIENSALALDRLIAEICLLYAGLAAERYHFKLISGSDNIPMFIRDLSVGDTSKASSLINKFQLAPPGAKRSQYKKKLIRKVSRELQQNWDAVTVIAHALFQRKRLDFSDLKELLTKKTKNKDFWKEQFKAIERIYLSDEVDEQKLKSILSL